MSTSNTKSTRQLRREFHEQMLRRYEKNRRRNLLAKPGVHKFAIVLDNLKAGYNVPKIFRSAEAFGAAEIHLVNIGPFDPAPSKGAFRQVPAKFHDDITSCLDELRSGGFDLFALDPTGSTAIQSVTFKDKSAFIVGHEERGFSFLLDDHPDIRRLHIPQFGKVESLNVSIAASIVMYEYTRPRT